MFQKSTIQSSFCTLSEAQSCSPMPSTQFVDQMTTSFEQDKSDKNANSYDRKKHILYIYDIQSYEQVVSQVFKRSVSTFEKQLKMMSFRKSKVFSKNKNSENSQVKRQISENQIIEQKCFIEKPANLKVEPQEKVIPKSLDECSAQSDESYQNGEKNERDYFLTFSWKSNKPKIVDRQLQLLEEKLNKQIENALLVKSAIEKRKIEIDESIEAALFENLINGFDTAEEDSRKRDNTEGTYPSNAKKTINAFLENCLTDLKIQSRNLIMNISENLLSELGIYRVLIFKDNKISSIQE